MFETIPKKVAAWLNHLNQDLSGSYGDLEWNFDVDNGMLKYGAGDNDDHIIIMWDGTPGTKEFSIVGNDKRFENIAAHLSFFIHVEKTIYSELEKLQYEIEKQLPKVLVPDEQSQIAQYQGLGSVEE